MTINLPSKVAVRQTKASNLRQGGWKGSQESLSSIGMMSTCSNKFRVSPSKFAVIFKILLGFFIFLF